MITVARATEWSPTVENDDSLWARHDTGDLSEPDQWQGRRPGLSSRVSEGWHQPTRIVERRQQVDLSPELILSSTFASLFDLGHLQDNWDGEGSIAPSKDALVHALAWITRLYGLVSRLNGTWLPPLVSDSADGGVMLEWWNHDRGRKLTVYIWDELAEYVQVWGPDMISQMDEGSAEPLGDFMPIWAWLTR